VSAIDHLLERSRTNPARFPGMLPAPPAMHVAIVTCMDARIDAYRIFGLEPGQAHLIRNAGGVVTDDVARSLAISQRKLGTREILLMQHTRCGLIGFDDEDFRNEIESATGRRPTWSGHSLAGDDADLRTALRDLRNDPALEHTDAIRGFVYDVDSGEVREVADA
jgi:carbonic anhydrase